jgi:hypothetical protein
MPEKVKKKVNNISFITSLEQIDAIITPKKVKPSVSKMIKEVSPQLLQRNSAFKSPKGSREESPEKISPQKMFRMEDQAYEIGKDQRELTRDIQQLESDMQRMNFNIRTENKYT